MKEAMESCMQENHSGLLKPANPILSLLNQNANTLPFPVNNNNPFQSLPAPAPSNNPFKSSNLNLGAWQNLWGRNKREATEGLLQPTEEDFKEFLMDFEDFKGDVASKMGNLTCVLKKMNALDDNLQINMKEYTGDFWNKIDLSQTMAGEDPEWRHMLVFKCARKEEAKACGMACANDMLTTLYGSNDAFDWTQYGMPQNKYERAAWTMKIMYGTASHEEHFVHDFFFSDPMM